MNIHIPAETGLEIDFHAASMLDRIRDAVAPIIAMTPAEALEGVAPEEIITANMIIIGVSAIANSAGEKGAHRDEIMRGLGAAIRSIIDAQPGPSPHHFKAFMDGFRTVDDLTTEDMVEGSRQ